MNNFKSHFKFNKHERSGIFFLLLLIAILQGVYFYIKAKPFNEESKVVVDALVQSQLDSLRLLALKKDATKTFSFNPNYISDYKGYNLGMTMEELDRLFTFRKTGKFVNSVEEFQQVTQISDSLLKVISPSFKFPEWVQKKKATKTYSKIGLKKAIRLTDLNVATAKDLRVINGIGEKLSERIIKFRDRLGGFLVDEQLFDVYGLEPEVVQRALLQFKVIDSPSIQKININKATVKEMSRLVYINRNLAERIVSYREQNGAFDSLDKLLNVDSFPKERIDRIKLYLTL
ncbi:helix-hairpin-helix domain-containing protein [Flagellimonas sp. S3867]|uniref:ComEA family DNA-binding protein n=1 Tax=Flagellimonas sp. S3867 TaxID=2768063 RepID=UPI00168325A7|nr:helix-hairpin-helix domain-containing protein [Flagellimonas sp. S3867]